MRDKHIEEMARDICEHFNSDGTCYYDGNPCDLKCENFINTQYIYKLGYRKASDVAREIFEEADKIFMATCLSLETYKAWCELKKKYESEGE